MNKNHEGLPNRLMQNLLPTFFIVVFFVHSVLSVRQLSRTYDESTHYKFGLQLLNGDAERPYESVMPISVWNALPSFLSEFFSNSPLKKALADFLSARIMSIIFACGIAYLVFYFSSLLYGYLPALISLFLFIFDPNILAHSQLVTTDIFATGSLLLVTLFAWCYIKNRNWTNRLLLASSLGFSLITKFTAMSFIPLFFLLIFTYDLANLLRENAQKQIKRYVYLLREYTFFALAVAVISILTLNIAYRFHRTFVPFGEYVFRTSIFNNLQKDYPVLNVLPIPVPYAHLQGFDWILAFEQTGEGHGGHYLFGQLREGEGFPGYYIFVFLLKEPFPSIVIISLTFIIYFIDRDRRVNFWEQEFFLLAPIVFYAVYFNFFYNSQIGIRYYIIIFPLLYIFSGSLFVKWGTFSHPQKILSILSSIYLAISVLSYYPYYIPYFNEFVWNRSLAYKYLADSNLDWGQARGAFEQYLVDNPDAAYPTRFVQAGVFIVSANDLVGITKDSATYAWLRDNFEPIDNVAYSYLIYHITSDERRELCLNSSYCAGE